MDPSWIRHEHLAEPIHFGDQKPAAVTAPPGSSAAPPPRRAATSPL